MDHQKPLKCFFKNIMITYQLTLSHPEAHLLTVNMEIPLSDYPQDELTLKLPAWIPGSYMIRDFARHIVTIEAQLDGQAVTLIQTDKHSWKIRLQGKTGETLTLAYQVYAFDLSVRGCFLDTERGFVNPAGLCLALDGAQDKPCRLRIPSPKGSANQNWQLATALSAVTIDQVGFGLYQAENYTQLIDSPIEMGQFTRFVFEAGGIPHEFILSGVFDADIERLKEDTQKICAYQIRLFNGQASFERYVFLLHVSDEVYGGLEHRASTALLASRDCLPAKGMQGATDEYIQLLGLISHEYFHAWNVKAIKPQCFVDYDLDKEVYTEQLWAFEGITSYYDDLVLLRAGLIDKAKYLDMLAQNMTRVYRGNGRTKQTLNQSSFTAWTKYYKQDENSPNAIVSYYQKGALFALCLDLLIRRQSNGQKSLDDVMRVLYQDYRQSGEGLAEGGWQQRAQEILDLDLSEFFAQGLSGTEDLPLASLLKEQGIDVCWTARPNGNIGGFSEQLPENKSDVIDLGMKYQNSGMGLKVTQVWDNGAAQRASISTGDELIAVNGIKITDLNKQLDRFRYDRAVRIHLFRHGVLREVALPLQMATANTCFLVAGEWDKIEWLRGA